MNANDKLILDLRPVAAPSSASPGARVYVLLPTLDELLGVPGFEASNPIALPEASRAFDPRTFFAAGERPTLH